MLFTLMKQVETGEFKLCPFPQKASKVGRHYPNLGGASEMITSPSFLALMDASSFMPVDLSEVSPNTQKDLHNHVSDSFNEGNATKEGALKMAKLALEM